MTLRDYQTDCVIEVLASWRQGTQRPAAVMSTGLGKTRTFAKLCEMLAASGHRPLILVDRQDLVAQTVGQLKAVAPGLVVGVIQGSRHEMRGHVIVASVQSLSRQSRLDKVDPDRFDRIIADECEAAAAPSWRRVLEHFGAFDPDSGTLAVGFTATLMRSDAKELGEVWTEVVFERGTQWAIQHGHLVPVEARTVTLADLDLAKVKTNHGDFSDGDLGRAMSQAGAGPLIAAAYNRYGRDDTGCLRRGIVFAPTIETAESFLQDFRDADIPSELIIGSTSLDERQAKYAATRRGENLVLVSVAVLTVGFDLPPVEVCVMARPTKSRRLFIQAVGRVLRQSPETQKVSALILDCVGATRLGLASVADLGLDEVKVDGVVRERSSLLPAVPVEAPEVPQDVEFMITDPFTGLRVPDPHGATRKKIMRRTKQRDQWLMTDGGTPFLAPTETYEFWTFLHHEAEGWSVGRMPKRGKAERVSSALAFPEAMWLAMQGAPVAADLEGMMTEGQERFLDRLNLYHGPGTTKQDASRRINQRLGSRKLD